MSDPTLEPSTPSLYGSEVGGPPEPAAQAQNVFEQFLGLFTEPSEVFKRLRQAPVWWGTLLLLLGAGLFASMVWAAKVDQVAMTERRFEVMEQAFRMNIPDSAKDQALDKVQTASQPYVVTVLGILFGMPVSYLVFAAILFAFARFGGEDEGVTFQHAWAATLTHALVGLPTVLLAGVIGLVRGVGGASSFASLAPTTLAFWVPTENPWLRGALTLVDPLYLFSFVLLFFAARHTLRLKKGALVGLMVLMGLFGLVGHIIGGVFA